MIRAAIAVAAGLGLSVAGPCAHGAVITGHVLDETGGSPASTFVLALDSADLATLDTAQTVAGRYTLVVPDGTDTLLVAIPFSGNEVAGYSVHEYTAGLELVQSPAGMVSRDTDVLRCYEVILEGHHPDGSLMSEADFPAGNFVVDGEGEATAEMLLAVDQGEGSVSVPTLCVPLGGERRVYMRRELEGAGLLDLPVDREGRFFTGDGQGAEVLDLNRATATTQLARLDELLAALIDAGYSIPAQHVQRRADLGDAAGSASGLSGGAAAQAWDGVAAGAVVAFEDLVLWRADRGAEIHRRGTLVITVESSDGWPVEGVEVLYEQVSHDFLFGIFEPLVLAGVAGYERLQEAGFNMVTAGFYWGDIEPDQGEVRWDYIDHDVGVRDLAAAGWRIKGHPLTWLLELAMPDFLTGLDPAELTQVSVEHVQEIMTRYRDDVRIWDVNNESSGHSASGGLTREEMDAYLVAVFDAARAADPTATLILNNHFDRFGGARLRERLDGVDEPYTLSVRAFVERSLAAGVDLDVVGQQMYNGGAITFFSDLGLGPVTGVPTSDLLFLHDTLAELAELGKPIHVTEQSVSSEWNEMYREAGAGYWRRPWDEEGQADFVEAFYRLCFGTEAVQAVTWWNAVDESSFISSGGLLHEDGTAKPALERLEILIDGWTSAGELETGADGAAELIGFAGDYRITVRGDGWEEELTVHVAEGATLSTTLVLEGPLAPAPRRPSGRLTP